MAYHVLFNIVQCGVCVMSCLIHVLSKQFQQLLFVSMIATGMLGALAFVGLTYNGWIVSWTRCFYSLWDTGHLQTVSAPDPFGVLTCPLHLLVHHPCTQQQRQCPRQH